MTAFSLGFVARNIATGVHPFTISLLLPSSTTPVVPGDTLLVESLADPGIIRRVTVLADGTIDVPHLGIVSVSGQDTLAIKKTLTTSYGRYYKAPAIQVYRADASQPIKQP